MSSPGDPSQLLSRRPSRVNEDGTVQTARLHHLSPMSPPSPSRRTSQGVPSSPSQPVKPSKPKDTAGIANGRNSGSGGGGLRLRTGLAGGVARTGMKPLQPRTSSSPSTSPPATRQVASSSPPPPQARDAARVRSSCACHATPETFLRGIDVLNRVFASAANPAGVSVPHTDVWSNETSSTNRMQRQSMPLLPVTIITDGESLVIVDQNGSSHHGNHKALPQTIKRTPKGTSAAASSSSSSPSTHTVDERPCVAWWTLDQLTTQDGGDDDGDVASASVASALAWVSSAHAPDAIHGQAALDALKAPYGSPSRALVVLICDEKTVRSTLHDACHCYLPAVLQAVYPGGVQLAGVWVSPKDARVASSDSSSSSDGVFCASSPLWSSGLAPRTKATSATTDARGAAGNGTQVLYGLYPSMQHEDAQTATAARLGHVAFPDALYRSLGSAPETNHARARMTVLRSVPHKPHTPPNDPARPARPAPRPNPVAAPATPSPPTATAAVGAASQARPVTTTPTGGGHVLGGGHTNVSRLLLAPRDGAGAGVVSQSPTTHINTRDEAGSTVPAVQADPPQWGERGDGLCYGTYTATGRASPSAAAVVCRSVLVYTPRGRVELEYVAPATASPNAVVTVADIKEGFARSALGRALRLRKNQYILTYAPSLPALPDSEVLATAHAVLRLIRVNDV